MGGGRWLVLVVLLALLVRIIDVGLGIPRVADVTDNYGCEHAP